MYAKTFAFLKSYRLYVYLVISALVLSLVLGLFFTYGYSGQGSLPNEYLGQRGDSFGRINALFSGLAFAGVVLALFVQIAELHLAENERREAKEVNIAIQQQAFISTFSAATDLWVRLNEKKAVPQYDNYNLSRLAVAANEFRMRKAVEIMIMQFQKSLASGKLKTDSQETYYSQHSSIEQTAVFAEQLIGIAENLIATQTLIRQADNNNEQIRKFSIDAIENMITSSKEIATNNNVLPSAIIEQAKSHQEAIIGYDSRNEDQSFSVFASQHVKSLYDAMYNHIWHVLELKTEV